MNARRPHRDSAHALRRCAQRSIDDADIAAALRWSRPIHQPEGRVVYHLGRDAVLRAARHGVDATPHENTAVVLGPDGGLVTVVRSPDRRRFQRNSDLRRRRGRR